MWIHFQWQKQFYFKQFSLALARSLNVSTVKLIKTFLFQAFQFSHTTQFSISMPLVLFNPEIGPYQALPRRARVDLGAMVMNAVPRIPQSSSIARTSPSDCLVLYPGNSMVGGGSYPSAEKQSVYSTALTDWAIFSGLWVPLPSNSASWHLSEQCNNYLAEIISPNNMFRVVLSYMVPVIRNNTYSV